LSFFWHGKGSVDLAGQVIAGEIDAGALRLVQEWRLLFDDGTAGDVDLSNLEWRGVFEPLRDPKYFAKVKVDPEAATGVWPNGADLAPETLYVEARKNPLIAA
jgi:hypothetical protein